jgi:hypothetical protein
MVHVNKKTKDRYKRRIQFLIKGFSRKVVVYKQSIKSQCDNCYYDKTTQSSTGKCKWTIVKALSKQAEWEAQGNTTIKYKYFKFGRCKICHGQGYIETQRKNYISCLITWNPGGRWGNTNFVSTPAGSEGSLIVQLKTDPKYFDMFKNCSKIVVDGFECQLSQPPILRGLGNDSLLIVIAFTTQKSKIDSNEIMKEY